MTEMEKNRKLDKKLRKKYPDASDEVYQQLRNQYIRRWNALAMGGILASFGGVLLSIGLADYPVLNLLCRIIGFVILVVSTLIVKVLPREEKKRLRNPEASSVLTVERIAVDCGRKETKLSIVRDLLLFFTGMCLLACATHGVENILENAVLLVPLALLSAVFWVLTAWKRDALKRKVLSGDYFLIRGSLRDKEITEGFDNEGENPKYYVFTFAHPEKNGIYRYQTTETEYDWANVGDEYYLAILKNRRGKETVLAHYLTDRYTLGEGLAGKPEKDAHLTAGNRDSEEEWRDKIRTKVKQEWKETAERVSKLSPEEREALPGKTEERIRTATSWKIGVMVVSVALLFVPYVFLPWYLLLAAVLVHAVFWFAADRVSRMDSEIHTMQSMLMAMGSDKVPQSKVDDLFAVLVIIPSFINIIRTIFGFVNLLLS